MRRLLGHGPQKETIFDLLHGEDVHREVCVLQEQDALYTLIPTFGGLDHDRSASKKDQKSNACFCRLDDESEDLNVQCSVEIHEETCHYARLGRLVRQDRQTKSRTTTNYILLLNASTDPIIAMARLRLLEI